MAPYDVGLSSNQPKDTLRCDGIAGTRFAVKRKEGAADEMCEYIFTSAKRWARLGALLATLSVPNQPPSHHLKTQHTFTIIISSQYDLVHSFH